MLGEPVQARTVSTRTSRADPILHNRTLLTSVRDPIAILSNKFLSEI